MKKNKLTFLVLLVLLVSILSIGCSSDKSKKNTSNREIDKNLELEPIEEDIPEEENNKLIVDGEDWPTESMDDIPELAGRITSASVVTDLRHIEMESVKKKDAESFVKQLKSLGFSVEPGESISSTMIVYNAKHEDKRGITFGWSDDGEVDIVYTLPFKPK